MQDGSPLNPYEVCQSSDQRPNGDRDISAVRPLLWTIDSLFAIWAMVLLQRPAVAATFRANTESDSRLQSKNNKVSDKSCDCDPATLWLLHAVARESLKSFVPSCQVCFSPVSYKPMLAFCASHGPAPLNPSPTRCLRPPPPLKSLPRPKNC